MGNNNSNQGFDPQLSGWQVVPGAGDRELYRHQATGQQIEGYRFLMNDVTQFGREKQAYDMRLNSNVLVASRYLIEDNESDLCSTYYKGEVFLQFTPYRLSQIDQIPYPDILHLYYQCFKGFGQLYAFAGYFDVTQDLICINRQGQVKVWLNPSLQKVRPEVSYGALSTQGQMINRIICILDKNTNHSTLPENIGNILIQLNLTSFEAAQNAIIQIAANYRTTVPSKLKSAEQLINQTNPVIPIITPQQSGNQSKLRFQPIIHQAHQIIKPITTRDGNSQQNLVSSNLPTSVNQSIKFSKNITPLAIKGHITFPQQNQQHILPSNQTISPQPVLSQYHSTRSQPVVQNKNQQIINYHTLSPNQLLPTQQFRSYGRHISKEQTILSSPNQPNFVSKFPQPTISPFQFKQHEKNKKVQHIHTQINVQKQTNQQFVGSSNKLIHQFKHQNNNFKNLSVQKIPTQNKSNIQLNNQHIQTKMIKQNEKQIQHVQGNTINLPNPLYQNFKAHTNVNPIRNPQVFDSKNNRRTISLQHHQYQPGNQSSKIKTNINTNANTKTQFFKQKSQIQQISINKVHKQIQPQPHSQTHTINLTSNKKPNIQFHQKNTKNNQTPSLEMRYNIQRNPATVKMFQFQQSQKRLSNTPINNVFKTPKNIDTFNSNRQVQQVEITKLQINNLDSEGCTSPQILAMIRGGQSSKSNTKNITQLSNQKHIHQHQSPSPSSFPLQFNNIRTSRHHASIPISAQKPKFNNPYVIGQDLQSHIIQNPNAFEHYSASKFREDIDEIGKKIDSLAQQNVLIEQNIIITAMNNQVNI